MAKTPKAAKVEDSGEQAVIFADAVRHDGEDFAAGDAATLPAAAARALIAAGAAFAGPPAAATS